MLIFKICHAGEWQLARRSMQYDGTAKDEADGFLHFSTEDQLMGTLTKWYADQDELILVAVDAEALGDALRWEPSRDGALFPHLYDALPLTAVRWTGPIERTPDGGFQLPAPPA